ncbi:hypothetical protein P4O66_008570, partial [Electrophorus voltai]
RGLNPPHRVKSISMTTFSQQEVEFLQNHGNEVGKRTWLCTFDPKIDGCFDTRDSQKFKEFLQDKYERKKWHFSKSKTRRDVEGPWSPGVQAVPVPHGPAQSQPPLGHALNPIARPSRTLSQSQLSAWDRPPAVSPADVRTEMFTARPTRSQSFRDPTIKGRTISSGGGGPFRAFPKSLSLDFGGRGSAHSVLSPSAPPRVSQDRYAAVSQLDKAFSNSTPATGNCPLTVYSLIVLLIVVSTAPSSGPPQYSTLFGNRLSSSSTPASSPGVPEVTSASQTFANFPNPFSSAASTSQPALSPSNPFNSTAKSDCSTVVTPSSSAFFPHSDSFHAQNAFPHERTNKHEANGFTSFPMTESTTKVQRPMSVNPFTGNVYPTRGASLNPFI